MKRLLIMVICLVLVIPSVLGCQKEEVLPDVVVSVKVVGDEEYRQERNSWQEEAKSLLKAVSEIYQKEFGIRFVVTEFVEWEGTYIPTSWRREFVASSILWEAKQVIAAEGNLVIILTGVDCGTGGLEGAADEKSRFVVVGPSTKPVNVLLHEISHIFGAKHPTEWGSKYEDEVSVMNTRWLYKTTKFDSKNRQIILENRDKFRGGGS